MSRKASVALLVLPLLLVAASAGPVVVDVAGEAAGEVPKAFAPVVGSWLVVKEGTRSVLRVDGRAWKRGNPAAGFAERARALYGSKHEDFIESVKAFAYFPYAVAERVDDFCEGEITVRFKLVEGALDQCAGILFDLRSNGDYLTVRFNDKEDNVVLWRFEKGRRSFVRKGDQDVPLPMKEWHTLKVAVAGSLVTGFLDDRKLLTYDLGRGVSGRVGVWSKTDSVTDFDDLRVFPRDPRAK